MKELMRNPDSFCKILELTVSAMDLDEIMIRVVDEMRELFDCDRCTLYVVDKKANELYARVGEESVVGIRLPVNRTTSIAGYVAVTGNEVMIEDVYDEKELKEIDKNMSFFRGADEKTSFRTEQMIAAPLRMSGEVIGVIQAMNKPGGFLKKDLCAMKEFSPVLALALNHALLVKEVAGCSCKA